MRALAILALLFTFGCESPSTELADGTKQRAIYPTYKVDDRTGFCFALFSHSSSGGLALVECTPKVMELAKIAPKPAK